MCYLFQFQSDGCVTVSILGQDKGYTVKYSPPHLGIPKGGGHIFDHSSVLNGQYSILKNHFDNDPLGQYDNMGKVDSPYTP